MGVGKTILLLPFCLALVIAARDDSQAGGAFTSSTQPSDTLLLPSGEPLRDFEDARSAELRSDGTLFITDAGTGNLYTFLLDTAGVTPDQLVPGLRQPDGLTLVMDTYTAVASRTAGEVTLLDEELIYMRDVSVPSWVPGAATFQPTDVASNAFGELFILDGPARRIYHFNANGAYLQHFELLEMTSPDRLVYHSESLFITDPGSGKLHVLTEAGQELAAIGTFPDLSRVRVLDGTIWILSGEVAHLFAMTGEHLANLKPEDPAVTLRDVAGHGNRVFLLTRGSLYFWELKP
ncbi:MAG: hypothetical protein EA363_07965 [Balneolaceae bacterium]|nr:MAG: hypothetical protein EA363_07965 [Balneolaceae bacterium]